MLVLPRFPFRSMTRQTKIKFKVEKKDKLWRPTPCRVNKHLNSSWPSSELSSPLWVGISTRSSSSYLHGAEECKKSRAFTCSPQHSLEDELWRGNWKTKLVYNLFLISIPTAVKLLPSPLLGASVGRSVKKTQAGIDVWNPHPIASSSLLPPSWLRAQHK